jgi:hypothetical protein
MRLDSVPLANTRSCVVSSFTSCGAMPPGMRSERSSLMGSKGRTWSGCSSIGRLSCGYWAEAR